MLYLMRKIGESIIINDDIELKVVEVKGKSVKIGFVFPPTATVLRKEIYEKITAENRAAATSVKGEDFFTAVLKEKGKDQKKDG